MNSLTAFIQAARPKVFILSISPVIFGTALVPEFHLLPFLYILLTAMGIQITSHYASDYFDFIKGKESKKGFVKVLEMGLVKAESMKRAIIFSALATTLIGSYLVWIGGPVIGICLAVSVALALLYNGGPYPLTRLGISDLIAFIFYGPLAVAGSYYLQTSSFSRDAVIAGMIPGAIAASVLMLNNLRDVEEDHAANKNTFPVRFGIPFGKGLYAVTMTVPFLSSFYLHKFFPLFLVFPAFYLVASVIKMKDSYGYHTLFKQTNFYLFAYTLLFYL